MMPEMDGLSVCKEMRKTSSVPVIILTARGDDVDKIVGLEIGADDYMTKPFNPRELVARVKAVLRRSQGSVPPEIVLEVADIRLDPAAARSQSPATPYRSAPRSSTSCPRSCATRAPSWTASASSASSGDKTFTAIPVQ